jgi:hypothetical protein
MNRRTVVFHELGHALVLYAEGATAVRLRVYDEPEDTVSALGNARLLWGITHSRGRLSTLGQARAAYAGYAAERLSGHSEPGGELDDEEVALARRLSDAASKAMGADPEVTWVLEVKAKVRKVLKLNRPLLDRMAAELMRTGYIGGRKLRKFLDEVERVDKGVWS